MSERIRVSQVDTSVAVWKVVRDIFRLNGDDRLVLDVISVEGENEFNEFDVVIGDGTRAMVIGKLGQIASISIAKQEKGIIELN